ncbi:MAG: FliI/YscN family ATPase [Planctomycetota bacterium]|nr:MAG: FliI/YscN family ATPase [Planctomycetota bacterium]
MLAEAPVIRREGVVRRLIGLAVTASGPAVAVGELCHIHSGGHQHLALVTGFREGELILQPLGHVDGIRPGDVVEATGRGLEVQVGEHLIGRVVDCLGRPVDQGPAIPPQGRRGIHTAPPDPLTRSPISTILETGIKAVDTLFTLGKGQRMGIFAGSGVGKSVLMGEFAKFARADVNVIALIGERGREIGEFVRQILGPEGLARSVVIIATSDRPAVERQTAAYTAHAIAEYFRDSGRDVLLMMDSLTRFCHAGRELGLAAGEPPTVRGYPPSVFASLPRLLERAGTADRGSITGIYTVLVDGDDESEPVADNVRAILDGHLFLSREMAGRAIYPAIDPTLSVSRLIVDLVSADEYADCLQAREIWGEYQRIRELVEIGAYQRGADPQLDRCLALYPGLVDFIRQPIGTQQGRASSVATLHELLRQGGGQA